MSDKGLSRRAIFALAALLGGACSCHTGGASAPPSATDPTLRVELLRRVSADQAVREEFTSALRAGRRPDSVLIARLTQVDAENTKWLAAVVGRRGWLGRAIVGEDGADAAFLLVQHADADTAFQACVLPL